jgi:putative redox protein
MKTKIDCAWKQDYTFEAEVNGFKVMMDTLPASGGGNNGPRPKPLVLAALAGCTGMDVVLVLKKMRVELEYFNISVEGEEREEHPKYYHKIHVIYELKGKHLDMEKAEKAVILSRDKYCAVFALLRFGAEITYEIRILD